MGKTSSETYADKWDKLFAEIDPMLLTAGALGGIAASGGIVPPFTRLLMLFGAATGANVQADVTQAIDNVVNHPTLEQSAGLALISPVAGVMEFWNFVGHQLAPSPPSNGTTSPPKTAEQVKYEVSKAALFASGALEAMMMLEVMRNPEVLTTIIKQPAEMLKGIGEIVPG